MYVVTNLSHVSLLFFYWRCWSDPSSKLKIGPFAKILSLSSQLAVVIVAAVNFYFLYLYFLRQRTVEISQSQSPLYMCQ